MPDTCEILIAIVHLARGLTLISSPALILHRKWLPFPGDCQLIFTGLENSYCRLNTSSSSTPQVTCLEVQTRGPNSCTSLILDMPSSWNVTWLRHSNVACLAAPSCLLGIFQLIQSVFKNYLEKVYIQNISFDKIWLKLLLPNFAGRPNMCSSPLCGTSNILLWSSGWYDTTNSATMDRWIV